MTVTADDLQKIYAEGNEELEAMRLAVEQTVNKPEISTAIEPTKKPRGRPFPPGNNMNPNGRPKGSRNKINQLTIDLLSRYTEEHGDTIIQKVIETRPEAFLNALIKVMPKQLEVAIQDRLADKSIDELREMRSKLKQKIKEIE